MDEDEANIIAEYDAILAEIDEALNQNETKDS